MQINSIAWPNLHLAENKQKQQQHALQYNYSITTNHLHICEHKHKNFGTGFEFDFFFQDLLLEHKSNIRRGAVHNIYPLANIKFLQVQQQNRPAFICFPTPLLRTFVYGFSFIATRWRKLTNLSVKM